jgi:riboflavin kinase/FMN adenylyltransferase
MVIVRSLNESAPSPPSAATVGTFDGVHVGHQRILGTLVDHAAKAGIRSVVLTFEPHPRNVVGKGPVSLLTTLDERLELFASSGVACVVVIDFTFEFSRQIPTEFFRNYLIKGVNAREIIIGYDHMFGRDRGAGREQLVDLAAAASIRTTVVPPVSSGAHVISSSSIRRLLARGDVSTAGEYLGRPYALTGTVVRGDGRGVQLGFPTANLGGIADSKMLPASGVYAVTVRLDGRTILGMMNIGVRPTFDDIDHQVLEVHLLDFDEIIYNRQLTVRFHRRLRDEEKFDTVDELKKQLELDRTETRNLLSELQLSKVQ